MRFKLFSLFLLVSFLCYSQERKDGDFGSYTIKQAQSPLVTNIVGWSYDESFKKWAGYKNLIMNKYKSGNNKTPLQASMYDMGDYSLDNILSMKFKSVVVNSVQYSPKDILNCLCQHGSLSGLNSVVFPKSTCSLGQDNV